ncbi:MAG: AGE family epimerase/isomerase [Actinomycetota bacterium]
MASDAGRTDQESKLMEREPAMETTALRDPHSRWVTSPAHRQWLFTRLEGLMAFSQQSIATDGGFAYLDGEGRPLPERPPTLLLAARMTHAAAIAHVLGVSGSGRLLDHGMSSLLNAFLDRRHGGWTSSVGAQSDKTTYEHVHVALAGSSALAAGHRDAESLLDRALDVFDDHLWQEEEGALAESWSHDWTTPEPYRGANANMHGVEAMLAVGDVTGDALWHERALRVASRIIDGHARGRDWMIPEHFDTHWRELPDYNKEEIDHPFRPYGATYGHSLEWSRFLAGMHASPLVPETPWLLEAAIGLATRALGSWGVDGREGLVYTADWDGTPVSTIRLHWPICEAIQACAVLSQATDDARWESWYRRLWEHANRYYVGDDGVWINELDESGLEAGTVWPGRPDVYHSIGTYVAPLVPLSPFVTLAAANGLLPL